MKGVASLIAWADNRGTDHTHLGFFAFGSFSGVAFFGAHSFTSVLELTQNRKFSLTCRQTEMKRDYKQP